ncbi:MAG: NMD3-related protein, partial [Candidatus Odinarchaeota archaeon]
GLKDKNIIVQREVTLTIQKNICPDCSKISRGSYEAIIQIRAKNRQLEEEERVKILNYIYNFIQKNNITSPEHAITKIKESISGFDLYFSSNNLARKISNEVAEEFGCAHKESSKLVGKDKSGKTLFKVVYSLRLPAFRLGDIIEWSGKYYILESIGGGSAQIVDISVNQKNSIPLSETWKISLILPRESLSCFLILAVEDNVIDLMDTKTYETFSVNKPTWYVEPGMELAGFTSRNGEIIIIPRIK